MIYRGIAEPNLAEEGARGAVEGMRAGRAARCCPLLQPVTHRSRCQLLPIVLAELLDEEVEVRLVFVLRLLAELVGEDLVHEEIGDHGADLAGAVDVLATVGSRLLRRRLLDYAAQFVDQVRTVARQASAPGGVDRRHGLAGLCRLQGITNWSRPIIM